MRHITLSFLAVALFTSSALAAIKTETVEYKAGDTTLKGFLAYDDALKGERPGILVMPEWWGLTDYPKSRARQLAEMGYVAFAADMYGDGKTTEDPKEAGQWSSEVKNDKEARRARQKAALQVLKDRPEVSDEEIAVIGFCFGGAMGLDMLRAGMDIDGVVTFHGALATDSPAKKGEASEARVLVLHGAADPLVPPAEVEAFEKEMKEAGITYHIVKYPEAKHAFSNPDADKYGLPPVAYQKEAAEQSWQAMSQFLAELFGKTRQGISPDSDASN